MSATVLTYISLGIALIALIIALYAIISAGPVRRWRKIFSGGKDGEELPENLEAIIEKIAQRLEILDGDSTKTHVALEAIAKQLSTATQHVGLMRYNGNGDDGGNLSFSLALLDEHQNGIIITSLHGRQNNRIYAKIVTNGASEQTLSDEERDALIHAVTQKSLI